jgi:hypothetical protein
LDLDSHRQDETGRDRTGDSRTGRRTGLFIDETRYRFPGRDDGKRDDAPHYILFVAMIVGGRGHDRDYD